MLPSCINPSNLPNLTHLKLCLHDMDELSQRILGGLPELRHLELSFVFYEVLIITIYAGDDGCFQKLISLSLPDLIVNFVLNEDSNVASHSEGIDEALFGSEKGDQCIVRAPVFMPNLELLNFVVEPCFKGSCDRLGLKYLPSLQKRGRDMEHLDEAPAPLRRAALRPDSAATHCVCSGRAPPARAAFCFARLTDTWVP
ncbi:hypothetical protein PR202_ga22775 [Eleusine coracana subsp. coracana]|uniref:Disease resistance R13L4/SHOC-2-like LRR domain-containing protein n=1 Tax=Eleusine coracana subsp. coracana TaxID=191504 RepID=A0AAV5D4T4_ELECO|nr:hypothetical protein PR202_ga22775 [Eleusine coracana subsp. coracana]